MAASETFFLRRTLKAGTGIETLPIGLQAGDIIYVWILEGRLDLAVIFDRVSRRAIGWAIHNRIKEDLAPRAVNNAIALRRPPQGRT